MPSKASVIVKAIMKDLNGRKGYDNLWDDMDDETKTEIILDLTSIVHSELNK